MESSDKVDELWEFSVKLKFFVQKNPTKWHEFRRVLELQKFTDETLANYNIRATTALDALIFPRYRHSPVDGVPLKPTGARVMRLITGKVGKPPSVDVEVLPASISFSGFFGWHLVSPMDREVVLTVDELDAMAVYQGCNRKTSLALPHGADPERIEKDIITYLDDFVHCYIWFPVDLMAEAEEIARILFALSSCKPTIVMDRRREKPLVRPLTFLQRFGAEKMVLMFSLNEQKEPDGLSMSSSISSNSNSLPNYDNGNKSNNVGGAGTSVKSKRHDHLGLLPRMAMATPADLRRDVRDEIIFSEQINRGIAQWDRFSILNRILGGFRLSELTVLTGPTGIGKTTFISEYAVDLWSQGVPTLYCSFEVPYVRINKTMLCQFARKPLWQKSYHQDVDRWLDRFSRTSEMLFSQSAYFDKQEPQTIIKAIRHQVKTSEVKHVIIDSLQAMMALSEQAKRPTSPRTKLMIEDMCISDLRRLASETRTHVTVILHPKNEEDSQKESGTNLYNKLINSRAAQEADNILALSKSERSGKKYLHIYKNRYLGEQIGNDRIEMVFKPDYFGHILAERRQRASD